MSVRESGAVVGLVTSAVALVLGAGVAHAATSAPDVAVGAPYQRTLTIGASVVPGRSEVVVPVTNTGTAAAHEVTVDVTSVPSRFAIHTVVPTLDPGASTVVSLGENTGQIYLGFVSARVAQAEPDATPADNTSAGVRFFVGDFTGIG